MRNLFLLFLLLPFTSFCQDLDNEMKELPAPNKAWEVGFNVGSSFYQGDLHCTTDDELGRFDNGGFAYGLEVKKNLNSNFAVALAFGQNNISGSDLDFSQASGHPQRGLSFENTVTTIGLQADYKPLGHKNNMIDPYIFAGLASVSGSADVTRNNALPMPVDDAVSADLMESAAGLAFPMGVGVNYNTTDKLTIGLEFGMVVGTNDYLDGVSKAASEEYNDFLGNIALTFSYKL